MIKAIIFDFFGVVYGHGTWSLYEIAGGDPVEDADFLEEVTQLASRGKISSEEFRQRISDKLGVPLEEWIRLNTETEVANEALLDFVKKINSDYKVAILSNAARGGINKRLSEAQQRIFDEIVVSAEVGYAKPDKEIFKLVAEKLGVEPEECVFTDDHAAYLNGAKKVGMKTILYTDFESFKVNLVRLLNY